MVKITYSILLNNCKKLTLKVGVLILFAFNTQVNAQEVITLFDEVLFYDGYAGLVAEEDLYEPVPENVLRHSNSRYAVKLTQDQLDAIGNTLEIEVNLKAACDNYDRLAHIFLAFVPPGSTSYDSYDGSVQKIEAARFITPFMNKNIMPDNLFFNFRTNNIAEILADSSILNEYDIWVELEIFGVPYAAQQQVAGCANRIDTFYGTLNFITDTDPSITYDDAMVFVPLAAQLNMNNYNSTDVPGETTRILNFELEAPVENAKLYLITSNHGANSGGEEYNRRWHHIYFNDELVHNYIPGGRSCEPFRQFNTQANGIYSLQPRSTRMWLSFNNWCPADVVPIREIDLGDLPAGSHEFKIDVPTAVFVNQEGYIPVSVYLHNRESGSSLCVPPTQLSGEGYSGSEILLEWFENGDAENWEILYGPLSNINTESITSAESNETIVGDLNAFTWYQVYVRSVCDTDFDSTWVGPISVRTSQLSIDEHQVENFQYFPNPVESYLHIKTESLPLDQITIFDLNGKMVLDQQPLKSTVSLDLNQLPAGVYFMTVRIENSQRTVKVVKK